MEPEKELSQEIKKAEPIAYRERFSSRQVFMFSQGGLLFAVAALGCLAGLVLHLIRTGKSYMPYMMTLDERVLPYEQLPLAMFDYYFTIFFTPIVLFLAAIFSAFVAFMLLRAAGAASKEVIARQDYELISKMLIDQNEKGMDQYIRLSSLTGITGIFTKVGLTGLPLATISLTMFFTFLSIWGNQFFDLAKLTLGAFIGSYVQKQVSVAKEEKPSAKTG